MTMLNFPRVLLEEIISRIPIKYMRAVRLTCKTLNSLTQSLSFTKLLIGKEEATREGEFRIILVKGNDVYLKKVILNGTNPSVEHLGKLTPLNEDFDRMKIRTVFHCEGLFLFISEDPLCIRLMVWNPFLGQTRWIEPKVSTQSMKSWEKRSYVTGKFWWSNSYVMGYVENKNESCGRNFKILSFSKSREHNYSLWYEIYDFDSGLATTGDVICPNWVIRGIGVSLKGNTYWSASEENSRQYKTHIISFDFTKEKFGQLMHLPFVQDGFDDHVTLFSVREEKLAVAYKDHDPFEVEIWITTKIEEEKLSFSKLLNVNVGLNLPIEYGISFFDEKNLTIGFYNKYLNIVHIIGKAGYYGKLDIEEPDGWGNFGYSYVYVPSLVQMIQPTGGK